MAAKHSATGDRRRHKTGKIRKRLDRISGRRACRFNEALPYRQ